MTPGGTSATNANAKFTYVAAGPTITSVAPSGGPITGGTLVTITGTNLATATASPSAGRRRLRSPPLNGTTISAIAPAHAAGVVDVVVTTPTGQNPNTAADNYTYGSVPVVTSSLHRAATSRGTVVTITGTGFTGATAVSFGGVAGTITNIAATTLTVTAPAHVAGTVDVAVTTPSGRTRIRRRTTSPIRPAQPLRASRPPSVRSPVGRRW